MTRQEPSVSSTTRCWSFILTALILVPFGALPLLLRLRHNPTRKAKERSGLHAASRSICLLAIVGAKAQAAHLVLNAGEAGENQDRRLDLGDPQRPQNLVARHVG